MLHTPLFKLLATVALLLGTVAAGIYSASHLALTLPLPYADPSRLVISSSAVPFSPPRNGPASFSYAVWRNQAAGFSAMAGFHLQNFYLQSPSGESERVRGSRVSHDFFPLLGSKPLLGRAFLPEDFAAGNRLVLLSDEFWKKRFHGAPDAIGRELTLDGANYRVIGVMPADFWFVSRRVQFWVLLPSRPNYFVTAVGRLKPGVTVQTAEAEARELERANGGQGLIRLQGLEDSASAATRAAGRILLVVLAVVVLICLLDVVPLLRSDSPRRTRLAAAARVWLFLLLKSVGGLLPIALVWLFLAGRVAPADVEPGWPFGGLMLLAWPFFLAACGVVGWALLDQNSRCPLCLSRLRMPIESGSWASLWVNRPGTESICPYGHGKLYEPGPKRVGGGKRRWTSYRDIWKRLFSESFKA